MKYTKIDYSQLGDLTEKATGFAVMTHFDTCTRSYAFSRYDAENRALLAQDLQEGLKYLREKHADLCERYGAHIMRFENAIKRVERNAHIAGTLERYAHYCECGRAMTESIYGLYDGVRVELICEECRQDMNVCPHCGIYHNSADGVEVHTEEGVELWCKNCAYSYAYKCDRCNRIVSRGTMHVAEGNVCTECAVALGYKVCEKCGRVHYEEGVLCFKCFCEKIDEELKSGGYNIKRYGYKPSARFYGESAENRFFGVELEITAWEDNELDRDFTLARKILRDYLGDRAYYKYDSSLNDDGCAGFEIVTHPHSKEEFLSLDWENVCSRLIERGYTSHDGGLCGLHVHISREGFGSTEAKQENAIAKMIYFYDTFIADVERVARRANSRWATPNGTAGSVSKAKDKGKKANERYNSESRYHNVNITNGKTIEVRVFRGTLNADTLRATIDFVATIARNATRIAWTRINDVNAWLEGIAPATREYLNKRNAFIIA